MRCEKCGAYLVMGDRPSDPIGNEVEIHSFNWAMDQPIKCWACGHEKVATRKPSDRPKLKMNPTPISAPHPLNAIQFYQKMKLEPKPWQRKAYARRLDKGL